MSKEKDDFFETIFSLMKAFDPPKEKLAKTILDNHISISTVDSSDCSFETAIGDIQTWHPVERYSSREEALSGHDKWVAFAKDLKQGSQITEIGYPGLPDTTVTIMLQNDPDTN